MAWRINSRVAWQAVPSLALALASCAGDPPPPPPERLIGTTLGLALGSNLAEADRGLLHDITAKALEALPNGAKLDWRNPDTNAFGSVTPVNRATDAAGRLCRDYYQTIIRQGAMEEGIGRACRDADGRWLPAKLS